MCNFTGLNVKQQRGTRGSHTRYRGPRGSVCGLEHFVNFWKMDAEFDVSVSFSRK